MNKFEILILSLFFELLDHQDCLSKVFRHLKKVYKKDVRVYHLGRRTDFKGNNWEVKIFLYHKKE